MKKHVMAMTYPPKIEAVQEGRCTQTIRTIKNRPVKVGDSILFHGWSGKAYRSEWNGKMRVTVKEGLHCIVTDNWAKVEGNETVPWDHPSIDELARRDFIENPTGISLRNVLFTLNGGKPPTEPVRYQVIRWNVDWKATELLRAEAARMKDIEKDTPRTHNSMDVCMNCGNKEEIIIESGNSIIVNCAECGVNKHIHIKEDTIDEPTRS